jgi:HK97 family phage prohead protease
MERRCAIELRAAGDIKSPRLAGYAAVFNSESPDLGGFSEKIAPGAFARTLRSNSLDPLALVQHVPHLVLGRRSAGTLKLSEDQRGLAFEVVLPETTTARDLMVSVARGDIRGASFAFSVPEGGDRWEVQGSRALRTLLDVDLHEITITPTPAYQDTSVALRALKARQVDAPRLRGLYLWLDTCR